MNPRLGVARWSVMFLFAGVGFFVGCHRQISDLTPVPPVPTSTATQTTTATLTRTDTATDTPTLLLTPTPSDTPTSTATPDPILKVDDMEDNDGQVLVQAGRSGYWYTYVGTGSVAPPSPFTMSSPGNTLGSSLYAARMTGNTSDYIGMGFNWVNPKALYDITQGGTLSGIRFYAMIGAGGAVAVRFKMPNVDTDPSGGNCSGQPGGCYNDFGHDYTFTNSWAQYSINFSAFTQQTGFGWTPPGGFNMAQVYACQWQLNSAALVDLWVDDISFY